VQRLRAQTPLAAGRPLYGHAYKPPPRRPIVGYLRSRAGTLRHFAAAADPNPTSLLPPYRRPYYTLRALAAAAAVTRKATPYLVDLAAAPAAVAGPPPRRRRDPTGEPGWERAPMRKVTMYQPQKVG